MGNAQEVMQWLGEAQIDAALASDPPARCDVQLRSALHRRPDLRAAQRPCAVGAVDDPDRGVGDEVLLSREASSKTRAFTERALADAAIAAAATLEFQGRETIREAIALGLGVSIFFASECPPDRRIDYRPLETGRDTTNCAASCSARANAGAAR